MKTQLAIISQGLTNQLQPLDVSVNQSFKRLIREKWNSWMESQDTGVTPSEEGRGILQVCECESFKRCCGNQDNCEIIRKNVASDTKYVPLMVQKMICCSSFQVIVLKMSSWVSITKIKI